MLAKDGEVGFSQLPQRHGGSHGRPHKRLGAETAPLPCKKGCQIGLRGGTELSTMSDTSTPAGHPVASKARTTSTSQSGYLSPNSGVPVGSAQVLPQVWHLYRRSWSEWTPMRPLALQVEFGHTTNCERIGGRVVLSIRPIERCVWWCQADSPLPAALPDLRCRG